MVPYEIALVAYAGNPAALCASLTAAGGMFPNTQGTTTSDVVNACSAAVAAPGATLRTVIIAIALATGGIAALEWLVEEEENTNDVPAPKPGVDPAPAPLPPPPDWDEQDCELEITDVEQAISGPKIAAHFGGPATGRVSSILGRAGLCPGWLTTLQQQSYRRHVRCLVCSDARE